MPSTTQLQLAPLGAGDLIDRAVRLYRRHLLTLVRIAAPPAIVTAIGWVLWAIARRNIFNAPDNESLALYFLLATVSSVVISSGYMFNLIVMGGATRNLVTHLLWNEPVSVRATYSAVRSRFWSLLGAMFIVSIWISMSFTVAVIAFYSILAGIFFMVALFAQIAPIWFTVLMGAIGGLLAIFAALLAFFFMVGRVAYVPQVMLVEGKKVFESVGRSFSLAKGNIRRLMAMALFVLFATQSALMILIVPLGWYGYVNGVDPSPFSTATWPAWYAIGYSVLEPVSTILLAPVWMLGLSLLYVDERVRHEAYDIELLASQRLGELPKLNVSSPLGTALAVDPQKVPPPPLTSYGKVLDLNRR